MIDKLNMSAEIRTVLQEHGMETKPAEVVKLLRKKHPRNKQVIDATSKKHFGISVSGIRRNMSDAKSLENPVVSQGVGQWTDPVVVAQMGPEKTVYTLQKIADMSDGTNLIEEVSKWQTLVRICGEREARQVVSEVLY